jgi:multisubunit Na+/H+ antiporter MnhB subunit
VSGLGTPGVGVAGFILSLLGFSLLGIILSWVGLRQARREGRPTGLCVAGIIIGFVWLAISIILIIVTVVAVDSATTYYYE